jgi:hypothetical protein
LRDYPNTEGLTVTNFAYSNSARKSMSSTRTNQANNAATNPMNNPTANSSI